MNATDENTVTPGWGDVRFGTRIESNNLIDDALMLLLFGVMQDADGSPEEEWHDKTTKALHAAMAVGYLPLMQMATSPALQKYAKSLLKEDGSYGLTEVSNVVARMLFLVDGLIGHQIIARKTAVDTVTNILRENSALGNLGGLLGALAAGIISGNKKEKGKRE